MASGFIEIWDGKHEQERYVLSVDAIGVPLTPRLLASVIQSWEENIIASTYEKPPFTGQTPPPRTWYIKRVDIMNSRGEQESE